MDAFSTWLRAKEDYWHELLEYSIALLAAEKSKQQNKTD
jgi:hypothetical protein